MSLTGTGPPGYDDRVDAYEVEIREDGVYVGLEEAQPQKTVMDQMVDVVVLFASTARF